MEILNNVWNALCTENAELVNYLLIPLGFIEAFLIMMLFTNLLNIKCSTKQKLLYVVLAATCSLLNNSFMVSPYNVIINYLILFIAIYFIFKQGFVKTIIALFLPALIFSLVNLSIVKIFTGLLSITYEQTESVPIYRLLYISIVYITVGFIIFILKHKNLKIKILEDFDKKLKSL